MDDEVNHIDSSVRVIPELNQPSASEERKALSVELAWHNRCVRMNLKSPLSPFSAFGMRSSSDFGIWRLIRDFQELACILATA